MRVILLILSYLCFTAGVQAKGLDFLEEKWDFGTIDEEGGNVTHEFKYTNNTDAPIIIFNVRTSCGCTTPEFSREPIKAGATGVIKIAFDPRFRPGIFLKDIYVYNSGSDNPNVLKISGDVTPRIRNLEEIYPYTLGDRARLGQLYLTFRAIPRQRLVQQSIEFKNLSADTFNIEFEARNQDPSSPLRLIYNKIVDPAADRTVSIGYYITEDSKLKGTIYDTLDIYIDDVRQEKVLYIKGVIED